jgi:hypothetical protein
MCQSKTMQQNCGITADAIRDWTTLLAAQIALQGALLMQKSVRSLALVTVLALTAAPTALANQTGCNPHPQVATVSTSSSVALAIYTVLSVFGL